MWLQEGRISYVAGGGRGMAAHLFLCHYYPLGYGADRLSHSLVRFKMGLAPDVGAWTSAALSTLGGLAPGTLVVRALHHQELCSTGRRPLDALGEAIARRSGGRYDAGLLAKRRVTRTCREMLTKAERIAELKGVYYWWGGNPGRWGQRVLILDDIVTTGATASAILEVVHEALPEAKLMVFSLARASPDKTLNMALMKEGL
ncbi:MAG TPA: hypothetical protein VL547_21610 [Dinghuibacter sp.]|jgi:predicted amidophosphoribosyltransferase|uniref:ComF family protein n=1 Tax=Dinghuibacter sp. TaxID=2024697 RepID=UPI002B551771|nr:hypothetical protein [Dinghuibacter sp.]HTJ14658.1 hypothetical protein [Dinghuibacter sp.]